MHIILGGTGHVGSAAAQRLLASGEPVTIVSRSPDEREAWERRGARLAVADVLDVDALRAVFRQGRTAFVLNPPADVSTDTDAQERRSVAAILAALHDSGLQHVVAESTMGAQPGQSLGDLGVLYELEQGLRRQPIPAGIIRAAYYMSNWDASVPTIRSQGRLDSLLPADLQMPMVAPDDLGHAAARLLMGPVPRELVLHGVEGPQRHSPNDVAAAFAAALGRPVDVNVIPRSDWLDAYRQRGFSEAAAASFARMTAASVDGGFPPVASTHKGVVTLQAYVDQLLERAAEPAPR